MPIVPESTPQASLNVPGVQAPPTYEFGKLGAAGEALGATIENSSIDIMGKIKTAEATNAALKQTESDHLAISDQIQKLRLQSPDGYIHEDPNNVDSPKKINPATNQPMTMGEQLHSWMDGRYQDAQKNMPSEMAAREYRSRILPYVSSQIALLQTESLQKLTGKADNDINVAARDYSNKLENNPDIQNFYTYANTLAEHHNSQTGITHDAQQTKENIQKSYEVLAMHQAQGEITQVLEMKKLGDPSRNSSIMAWKDVMEGKDPDSIRRKAAGLPIYTDMISPQQKTIEEDKIIRLLQQTRVMDKADIHAQLREVGAAEKANNSNPNDFSMMMGKLIGKMQDPDEKERGEYASLGTDLIADHILGQNDNWSFHGLSSSAKDSVVDSYGGSIRSTGTTFAKLANQDITGAFGAIAQNKITEKLNKFRDDDSKILEKNVADFYQNQSWSPLAGSKIAALDFKNPISLGVGTTPQTIQDGLKAQHSWWLSNAHEYDEKVLNEKSSKDFSDYLKNPNNVDQTVGTAIKSFQKGYQNSTGKAFDEMIADKNLSSAWRLPGLFKDPATSAAMVSAIRGTEDKSIDQNFTTLLASKSLKEDDLFSAVGNVSKQWIQGEYQSNPLNTKESQYSGDMNTAIKNYAKILYVRSGGNTDLKTVAKQAFNEFIGDHEKSYDVTPWSGSPSKINMPKDRSDEENDKIVDNAMSIIKNPDTVKSVLKPVVPSGVDPDIYNKWISNNARPISVKSPIPGFQFAYTEKDGVKQQMVMTYDINGKQVPQFISSESLAKQPDKPGFFEGLKNWWSGTNANRKPQSEEQPLEKFDKDFESWKAQHVPGSTHDLIDFPPGANKPPSAPGVPANVKVYRGEKLS